MEVIFHKQFKKKLEKLPHKIQKQFYDRLELFIKDQNHKTLHNHSVDKAFTNCRSINVTVDDRVMKEGYNRLSAEGNCPLYVFYQFYK